MTDKPETPITPASAIDIGIASAFGAYPAISAGVFKTKKRRPDLFPKLMALVVIALVAAVTILILTVVKG